MDGERERSSSPTGSRPRRSARSSRRSSATSCRRARSRRRGCSRAGSTRPASARCRRGSSRASRGPCVPRSRAAASRRCTGAATSARWPTRRTRTARTAWPSTARGSTPVPTVVSRSSDGPAPRRPRSTHLNVRRDIGTPPRTAARSRSFWDGSRGSRRRSSRASCDPKGWWRPPTNRRWVRRTVTRSPTSRMIRVWVLESQLERRARSRDARCPETTRSDGRDEDSRERHARPTRPGRSSRSSAHRPRRGATTPATRTRRHEHGYHKVLFCLAGSIVFHTDDGDLELTHRRPAGPGAGDSSRGDRRARRVPMRRGLQVKVAFHVDQLWFRRPGGIGTYVRELLDALPASRRVAGRSCRSARSWRGRTRAKVRRSRRRAVPGVERSVVDPHALSVVGRARPSRAPRRRCATPPSSTRRTLRPCLRSARRSAAGRDRPRPRVRTVPGAVPAPLAVALSNRAARGGETSRRDPRPVAEHGRRPDRVDIRSGRPACM